MKRSVWTVIGSVVAVTVLVFATMAIAGPGGEGRGEGKAMHEGRHLKGRVIFGEITAISESSLTVKPQLPPHVLEMLKEHGREAPELPASVTLSIDSETRYLFEDSEGSLADFKAGDIVVLRASGKAFEEQSSVRLLGDPESMKKRLEEKRGQGQGKRGKGKRGKGQGHAMGSPGGPRPHFGEITAVTDNSITIRPEIPAFVAAAAESHGIELPTELPAEITLPLGERTKYFVDSERQEQNPFSAGDRVSLLVGERFEGEGPAAFVVSDWATTEARMEQMQSRREQRESRRRERCADGQADEPAA